MAIETLSTTPETARRRAARASPRVDGLAIGAGLAALVCAIPTLAVFAGALAGGWPKLAPGAGPLLLESALGLLALLTLGGGGALTLGAVSAWLVATCRFPGRGVFEWLLVAPLAAPAYVLAYAYGAFTAPGGPFPIGLSGTTGASFVFALAFYPYVYVAARAAFATQSAAAMEAARTLGVPPWRAFLTIGLPLAWPGLAAGGALALMEIAADYGAASYFGAPTLTTGVFRAWFSRGEPALALQIASMLLIAAGAFFLLERVARGRRGFAANRARPPPRFALTPGAAWLATAFCGLLALLGFGLPALWLARLTSFAPEGALSELAAPLRASLLLGSLGAALTLALALPIALAARWGGRRARLLSVAASVGYAAPGAVIALGALSAFAALREAGLVAGLAGGAAVICLVWTYAARFLAAGAQPIEAGLMRVTPSLAGAARTLGANRRRLITTIEAPLAGPSLAAAALILFVEILRELPATLILRPFGLDTLAVAAHSLAADDRLAEAAGPALLIMLVGLAPILAFYRGVAGKAR